MAIYMEFDPKIKGTVTDAAFKDWVAVDSFQFGVGRGVASPVGGSKNREASLPSVSEIVVTKAYDPESSPGFLKDALRGGFATKVKIAFVTQTGGDSASYLNIELEGAGLSGWSMSSGGDKPSESVSINFTKITYAPFSTDDDNEASAGSKIMYDLAAQKTQ
jgi:type VI secretion system secreted protein Hcp